jgi:predicted amidohydrolase
VFDVSNEVRGNGLACNAWSCSLLKSCGMAASQAALLAALQLLLKLLMPLAAVAAAVTAAVVAAAACQSYGIKVGYGAGGPNSQTVKPGEGEQRKASSCC